MAKIKMSQFKTDLKKAEKGVKHTFDEKGKVWVRVAAANNKKFLKGIRQYMKPYKRSFGKNTVPEESRDRALNMAFAEYVWLGMGGFIDDLGDFGTPGDEIEDTFDNRLKILEHPNYAEFKNILAGLAGDEDAFKVDVKDEVEGNSEPSTDGKETLEA